MLMKFFYGSQPLKELLGNSDKYRHVQTDMVDRSHEMKES